MLNRIWKGGSTMGRIKELIDFEDELEYTEEVSDLLSLLYDLEQRNASDYEIQRVKDKLSELLD